jgi:hypothetical protein
MVCTFMEAAKTLPHRLLYLRLHVNSNCCGNITHMLIAQSFVITESQNHNRRARSALLSTPAFSLQTQAASAGIFKQLMGGQEPSRNRFVVPARHRLAESIPWNRFLGSIKV